MVTIKDIAKKAGVSHGTVSNVINNKGNVSVKKIKQVNQAIKELGYISNESAKLLRRGETNIVSILVPNTSEKNYIHFINGINNSIDTTQVKVQIFNTQNKPEIELEILNNLAAEQNNSIIAFTTLDDEKYYTDKLPKESSITFVERIPKNATSTFSFNLEQALNDLRKKIVHIPKESLAIILDDSFHPFEDELIAQLLACETIDKKNVYRFSIASLQKKIYPLISNANYTTYFTTNTHTTRILADSLSFLELKEVNLLSITGDDTRRFDDNLTNYYLNYYELGVSVAKSIILKQTSSAHEIINCSGFIENNYPIIGKTNVCKLSLLSVPNPTIAAINSLKSVFEKKSNTPLKLTEVATTGFEQELLYNTEHYDLIRIDVAQFPMEARRTFKPLSGLSPIIDKLIEQLRNDGYQKFMEVNGVVYGLPLDPSYQMLFYRKDIFADPIIKRLFLEKNKQELVPPTSWDDYQLIAKFFHKFSLDNTSVRSGLTMNVSNISIIATDFFGGYYSLGGKLLCNDNKISLDENIAVKAVQLYNNLQANSTHVHDSWWEDIIDNYLSGKTTMLLGYMNHLSRIAAESIMSNTGYTSAPGTKPLLGGGVIGINRDSDQLESSINFLVWLFDQQTSREITRQGGTTSSKEINRLEEFSLNYPWLYDSNLRLQKGIRENTTEDGIPINLKIIEHTVGNVLKESEGLSPKKVVKKINQILLQNSIII